MAALGKLKEFRTERTENDVLHLVFDTPGRPMNVFSNAAIAELVIFSEWLPGSDVKGVVIRSGKPSAFCAGADLTELGLAYDMIMAAPAETRDRVAFDHFFPLSCALRRIETAGKPVAAAIAGLALGGGGELALAAHHRVMVDDPKAAFGLPESLVGLLPVAGGTQRLPRLIGIEKALPVLLDGARLSGHAADVVDQLVPAGEEVMAAERWVLSHGAASQPWDRPGWRPADADRATAIIEQKRGDVLAETLGHYPAPLAILDCVSQGLPQPFDDAIRTEMRIFSKLIQRREPRNMIRTLFLGRLDHDRLRKAGGIPAPVEQAVAAVSEALQPTKTRMPRSPMPSPVLAFADPRARPRHSMASLHRQRFGWRQSPSRMVSARYANVSRGRTPLRTNGRPGSRRTSVAPRTICWSGIVAFPLIWAAPFPPLHKHLFSAAPHVLHHGLRNSKSREKQCQNP
jgi:3-hydroxyacyl-CoA dehydrogenase/enoyl-CoA hydratase/3-hydroxybutyryl-CoA epimerase